MIVHVYCGINDVLIYRPRSVCYSVSRCDIIRPCLLGNPHNNICTGNNDTCMHMDFSRLFLLYC